MRMTKRIVRAMAIKCANKHTGADSARGEHKPRVEADHAKGSDVTGRRSSSVDAVQALAKSRMHFRKARKCGMQSVQHSKLSVNITLASADAKKHSRHSQRWEHFTHAENPQRDGEQPRGQRGHFVADYAEASRSNEARAGNVKLKTSGVKIMPGLTSPIQERGRRDHQTHGAEQGLGSADSTTWLIRPKAGKMRM